MEEYKSSEERPILSTYYPIPDSGEIDVLDPFFSTETTIRDRYDICLPVVTEKDSPLEFRRYAPGDPVQRSIVSKKLMEPILNVIE